MEAVSIKAHRNISLIKILVLIFIPTSLLTIAYFAIGHLQERVPSQLLFFLLALVLLFPIELGILLKASKKEYGYYSVKSAFSNHRKLKWWVILFYGSLLWAFAGLMSIIIVPLENMLFAPLTGQLTDLLPTYFHWNNISQLKQFPDSILLLTCIMYFILNGLIGPIIEEMFFRGYLTSKISRYGKYAPLIITVLFSLYHFWLPFNNIFRFIVFYPAAYVAWKMKNIYIAIVFHCLSNMVSVIGLVIIVYGN